MTGSRRLARLALTGLLLLAPAGCAALRGPRGEAPRVVRPEDPADYDFLVGRELELDGDLAGAYDAYARALAKDPDVPLLHRKLAELAARQGRYDEALAHARRAHELDPDDTSSRLFLGTLYRLSKDAASAESVLRGPDGHPISSDAAILLYSVYLDADRLEDALGVARWLVAEDRESLRGYFALSGVYERMKRPKEADRALRQALERDPGNLSVYGALARARHDRGDRAGEIAIYREVLKVHPHHHATLLALADALAADDKVDDAVRVLEDVRRRYPDDLRSVVRLGFLQYQAKRYPDAAALFEQALAQHPDQYEIAYFLGLVRRRMDDETAAIAAFERIPESDDRYADARSQLAGIYEKRGDYAAAIAEVERARAKEPTRGLDLYLASLRARSGDFAGGVSFLEGLLAKSPDDDQLLYNLGVLHGEAKQYDESMKYMQQALEKNPDNAAALNYVGYSWAERGENLDQAEAMITRALQLRPEDGFITDSLAWVYYQRARPLLEAGRKAEGARLLERAYQELRKAEDLTGGDPVISEHLGDVLLLKGQRQLALEKYREALSLDPRPEEQPDLRGKAERLERELEGR